MINSKAAVAIHVLSLLAANPHEAVSSGFIAGSVNTNPVVIRRIIGELKQAGLLTAQAGSKGASLNKEPEEITLLEIYCAVQTKNELFAIHEKPNPECTVGKNIQSALETSFMQAQYAMEQELAKSTLADVMGRLFV